MKDFLQRLTPAYRARNYLAERIDSVLEQVEKINKKIDDFDQKNEYLFWLSQQSLNELPQETKKRIFLSMPKATGQLREIQLAENFILQRIKDVCDNNDIQFWLMGGTLLGAVRHLGFIPWDDDIDIGMMSEDVERLLSAVADDPIIAINQYYYHDGASIFKAKYKFSESIFLDIFPFDYLSCEDNQVAECWEETQRLRDLYWTSISKIITDKYNHYRFIERPICIKHLDEESNSVYCEIVRKSDFFGKGIWFAESIKNGLFRDSRGMLSVKEQFPLLRDEVEFEGKSYDVWKGYQKRMEMFYGDIWTLPRSVGRAHSSEFDGVDECLIELKKRGII